MNAPFKVLPSSGYKNTQFQVISEIEDLKLIVSNNGVEEKTIIVNSPAKKFISDFVNDGRYEISCEIDNIKYAQFITVDNAYRYGSGEFKAAYTFDDLEYSFILMKDRMLIYNELSNQIYTENAISPTDIKRIDDEHILLITKIKGGIESVTNFALYNLEELKITCESRNTYIDIDININENKIWCKDNSKNEIVCFEIKASEEVGFIELLKFKDVVRFVINPNNTHIIIELESQFIVCNIISLEKYSLNKSENTAIDQEGYFYELMERTVCCSNKTRNFNISFTVFDDGLNIDHNRFIFVGANLKHKDSRIEFFKHIEGITKDHDVSQIVTNKNYSFSRFSEIIENQYVFHKIFPTDGGILLVTSKETRKCGGVRLSLDDDKKWKKTSDITISCIYNLVYKNATLEKVMVNESPNFSVINYNNQVLVYSCESGQTAVVGINLKRIMPERTIEFLRMPNATENYFLEKGTTISVFSIINGWFQEKLRCGKILNLNRLKDQKTIWYENFINKSNEIRLITGYDLINRKIIKVTGINLINTDGTNATISSIHKDYFRLSNDTLFSLDNGHITNVIKGTILSVSSSLNKIISKQGNKFCLHRISSDLENYTTTEISIEENKYVESYISPDGNNLVLQNMNNEYQLFDIEKNQTIKFFSEKFLSFSSEGNIILEDDKSRAVKIIDPSTFKDITPPNYKYYRFMSPDGKLYSQLSMGIRKYGGASVDKYIEIGIVGTNCTVEIPLPMDLEFFNYAAFSYDNEYFACVGKPPKDGLIQISKIKFNATNNTLSFIKNLDSFQPECAAWVCGFSKTGYLAAYDSVPNTYVLKFDNQVNNTVSFERKTIDKKNFMCFSPSGNFLALSEQGYSPKTLGGYGHQESNVVHIAKSESTEIIDSFIGHGDIIKDDKKKKVVFVAFSEDERRIMTMSGDGVVFVRNIKL